MATYIPDPSNVTEPLDTRPASTAAAEFRAMKTFLQSLVLGGLPPVTGKNGWTLQADTAIPGAKWVDVKSLPSQAGNASRLLTTDGTDAGWATFYSFLPSLAGKNGQLARVNAAQTALEYATFFSQFPAGSPGYLLRLTTGGTDLEWTNAPALGAATATTAAANNNTTHVATTSWVRQATFATVDSPGTADLWTPGSYTIENYLQATRNNLRYIKETQIPGVLAGNAASATKLQTARLIGGVSFDGTANINLPGVNIAGNQNTSGNAATANYATDAGQAVNATTALNAGQLLIGSSYRTFQYSGQSGTPAWLWGTNDGATIAVWSPANFSVNYANSSGSAGSAGSAAVWTTARNITIGSQTLSVNGGGDVNFTLGSIGAQPTIGGIGLSSITLTTTTGSPGGGAAGSIVGVY